MSVSTELDQMIEQPGEPQEPVDVKSAAKEAFREIQEETATQRQAAEQAERQRQAQIEREYQEAAHKEAEQEVTAALIEAKKQDTQFAQLVDKSDLSASLIDVISRVGEPDEAKGIVTEFLHNEDLQQSLKRAKTEAGVLKIVKRVRKDVLRGGVPDITHTIQEQVPNYNFQEQNSQDEMDYSGIAMEHGI